MVDDDGCSAKSTIFHLQNAETGNWKLAHITLYIDPHNPQSPQFRCQFSSLKRQTITKTCRRHGSIDESQRNVTKPSKTQTPAMGGILANLFRKGQFIRLWSLLLALSTHPYIHLQVFYRHFIAHIALMQHFFSWSKWTHLML